jgi:hypothetical protein
LGVRRPL